MCELNQNEINAVNGGLNFEEPLPFIGSRQSAADRAYIERILEQLSKQN